MTAETDDLNNLISELSASLSQPGSEAFLRRINAERLLRLSVDEIIEQHQASSIRILPDRRIAGKSGADFLLQVDDYDLRLVLLDAPEERPALDLSLLNDCMALLEDNPSTVALILIWTTDDLLSIPVSIARLRYLLQTPHKVNDLLKRAKPFTETVSELIHKQTKLWDVGLEQIPHSTAQSVDLYRLFSEEIGKAIDMETRRSYRNDERLLAARNFPYEQEKKLILTLLQEALQGASAKELEARLLRVSKRGMK
jgi:hypothetical protein